MLNLSTFESFTFDALKLQSARWPTGELSNPVYHSKLLSIQSKRDVHFFEINTSTLTICEVENIRPLTGFAGSCVVGISKDIVCFGTIESTGIKRLEVLSRHTGDRYDIIRIPQTLIKFKIYGDIIIGTMNDTAHYTFRAKTPSITKYWRIPPKESASKSLVEIEEEQWRLSTYGFRLERKPDICSNMESKMLPTYNNGRCCNISYSEDTCGRYFVICTSSQTPSQDPFSENFDIDILDALSKTTKSLTFSVSSDLGSLRCIKVIFDQIILIFGFGVAVLSESIKGLKIIQETILNQCNSTVIRTNVSHGYHTRSELLLGKFNLSYSKILNPSL